MRQICAWCVCVCVWYNPQEMFSNYQTWPCNTELSEFVSQNAFLILNYETLSHTRMHSLIDHKTWHSNAFSLPSVVNSPCQFHIRWAFFISCTCSVMEILIKWDCYLCMCVHVWDSVYQLKLLWKLKWIYTESKKITTLDAPDCWYVSNNYQTIAYAISGPYAVCTFLVKKNRCLHDAEFQKEFCIIDWVSVIMQRYYAAYIGNSCPGDIIIVDYIHFVSLSVIWLPCFCQSTNQLIFGLSTNAT